MSAIIYSTIVLGVISFAATNVDDIFLLTALFSQAGSSKAYIVAGQYLGIITLTIISLSGSLGVLFVPKSWIRVLGVIPVYMGVKMFFSASADETILRHVLTDWNTYKVAVIVIGNGADNIGVYIPMFMQADWLAKMTLVTIFLVLTGVWCWIAYKIVDNACMGNLIQRYQQWVIPTVLIVLGGYIMFKAGTLSFLVKILSQV